MTTLTKIRNRAGLLVGIIAFALAAFILGDFFRSGQRFFGDNPTEVAKIGDKSIAIDEFNARVEEATEAEKQKNQSSTIEESQINNIKTQTWNQMVYENVMKTQYEELGIMVGTNELFDMVQGKSPHPSVVQAFTDPKTGQFNPGAVINFLKNLDQDQTGATKQRWLSFEKAIKTERLSSKYNNLVKAGLYVTKSQAKNNYVEMNRTAKFQYVVRRYNEIPDSTIKVEEADLKNYYNQNKNKYKQDQSARAFDYVVFEAVASPQDQQAVLEDLTKLKDEFKTTKDDTAFVNGNSDVAINGAYYKKGALSPMLDTALFNAPVGTVVGPYAEGMSYKLTKLTGTRAFPDSVKARHILIKIVNGDTKKANAKADSLKKLLKSGAKFEMLALLNSEDEGSKIKGGDLGWFKEGMMVAPFNDACFRGNKGDMPIVESQFGIHLIEILDKGKESKRIQIATIDRQVRPSNKTYQVYFGKASEFAGKYSTAAAFDKAIVDMGLNKRIADNVKELDANLPGIDGAREIVRWSFKAQKDEISPVYEASGKYIIAKLTNIKDKGQLPLEAVKEAVEFEAKKEKKAEQFTKEITDAMSAGANTLETIAAKFKTSVAPVDNANFSAGYLPGLGREVEVSAFVFAGKKGAMSKVLKGDAGVFVAKVEDITEPKPSTDNYKSNSDQLNQQMKQRADYELFEALKDKANIVDNRARFM